MIKNKDEIDYLFRKQNHNLLIKKEITELQKKFDELKIEFYNTKDEATANYISVLGIFASVVTFLLVEIQILQNTCSFSQLLGLSLIISSLLLSFNIVLLLITKSQTNSKQTKLNYIQVFLFLIIIILFLAGIFFANKGINEHCATKTINEKVDKNLEKQNIIFEKILLENTKQNERILRIEVKDE